MRLTDRESMLEFLASYDEELDHPCPLLTVAGEGHMTPEAAYALLDSARRDNLVVETPQGWTLTEVGWESL
jgi:hypothetical protein